MKLRRNQLHCITQCYGLTWQGNFIFCFPIQIFSPWKHGNFAKDSIRTFPKWKRGRVENGVQTCGLTAAGDLHGRHQLANMRGKRWSECLTVLYSGHRMYCTDTSLCGTEWTPYVQTLFIMWHCMHTVCTDTVHYVTLNIVLTHQYSTFLLQTYFLNLAPYP